MIVSDSTPLNYLILIGAADVLPKLYARVLIPPAVRAELNHGKTPERVRAWVAEAPGWIEIITPSISQTQRLLHLGRGEAEAIILALEQSADLLLIDERDGTGAARSQGLRVTGTIGVLDQAAKLGLLDLSTMFARLDRTTFRSPKRLLADLIAQDAARKRR